MQSREQGERGGVRSERQQGQIRLGLVGHGRMLALILRKEVT